MKAIVGDKYNVPTIAVLRDICDVDTYDFPSNCVIKPTQASGSVILRLNDEALDRQKIKQWFSINYYEIGREANYKTVNDPRLKARASLLRLKPVRVSLTADCPTPP